MRKAFNELLSRWAARLPFTNLRARLMLLLFLALLPAYGFILYSVFEARQQAAAHASENALWLMRLMALEQKSLIEVIRAQLQSFAQLPIVRRPGQAALCSRTFANLRAQNELYANIGVIDPDGALRCSALPFAARVDFSNRDYFREAMRTRAFTIGGYQIGVVTGKGNANLAVPVLDAAGNPQAVVFIALDLGAMAGRLIETTSLPEGSTLIILDDHGTILVRQPDPEQWVGKSLPDAPLIRTILGHGQEGSAEETGIDGVKRLYVFKPFYSTAAKQIYISAGIPTATIYADTNALLFRALLLMTLVTTAVIALAWVGGRLLLLRPANALMAAARRLGQGNLAARTGLPHSAEEFGQLAHVFDEMAQSIEEREHHARTSAARFTNIVNLAADAIISVDEEQRILVFNQGAERIFGYMAAEVVGQPLDRLLPAHLAATHRAHVRHFAAEPDAARDMNRRAEIHGRHKDGTEFPAEASISKVEENGKFQFTVFLRDISARKQAEEEIHRLNANLEHKVIERTAELAVANQELEAFSYSVSHDLRAPLRSIDGFSQALLEDCADRLDDQGRGHLHRVRAATQHMGHLIDDLIKLARVARAEMKREAVDLSALARSVLAVLQTGEPERKVDWRIEPGLVAAGDASLLRVALDNLLGNAWKFTAKIAHAHIEFGALHREPGGPAYFVRDNGAGFDMIYAGKLFGAFQRLHNVSEFPGTGIGLATVQRIIRRHGGLAWAEGATGKGATFYFSL